ncbi:oxidoreductase [Maritimibacter sp. UBA3975]|uniref:oxidoreductase n=1 Tax=Maritimibacter sp. UBA3975 TaxID=1946833 RepID=UPI000C092DC6|nr:oxidoreductase [Maritimibacter sp. UBA3975]MAM62252.1 short-chain dehydrogenase [Maritimibacter sp.]
MSNWTKENIPDMTGKRILITGGTSGLGRTETEILAGTGAEVIVAARNTDKGDDVVRSIREARPDAKIEMRQLDLASLASIESFAHRFTQDFDRLDVLINNAGVMVPPYGKTEDGFELQMGTNHFGTFALTGRLLPLLRQTPDSRVVVTSSMAHRQGDPDLSDLDWTERKYNAWQAYGDSKIANLLFTFELDRRLDGKGPRVIAAHPGWTATDLQRHSEVANLLNHVFAMKPEQGALSPLRAATDPTATSGEYYGPTKMGGMRGYPEHATAIPRANDRDLAAELWAVSTERTGVSYDLAA